MGSNGGTISVWDLENEREIWTLEGHTLAVMHIVVTSDGKRAISGSMDDSIKIWDLESGREIRTLKGHSDTIFAIAVTLDRKESNLGISR